MGTRRRLVLVAAVLTLLVPGPVLAEPGPLIFPKMRLYTAAEVREINLQEACAATEESPDSARAQIAKIHAWRAVAIATIIVAGIVVVVSKSTTRVIQVEVE